MGLSVAMELCEALKDNEGFLHSAVREMAIKQTFSFIDTVQNAAISPFLSCVSLLKKRRTVHLFSA